MGQAPEPFAHDAINLGRIERLRDPLDTGGFVG
jgi:hypothetical protein